MTCRGSALQWSTLMPMRAYRASRDAFHSSVGDAGAHVAGNLTLWMIGSAVFRAVAMLLLWQGVDRGGLLGHVAAIGGMLLGILVMTKAQEGHVAPDLPDRE